MAVVNIRRDVDDKFYRYRMPLLQIKIEGRGNGIKTVIPNMSDIARALSRPATYPTKYFGCELGAQTSWDEKAERYIVNGAHDANALRKLLDDFIAKFVLCGDCKNPETDLKLLKDGMITRDCKACGKRSDVDMRHKLTTFITKNPPPKRAKGTKGAGKAAGQSVGGGDDADDGGGSDDELTKKIQAEARDIPTAEQRRGNGANDDDVEWSVDTSEAAVKARVQALEGKLNSSLVLGDDDDDAEDSPYGQFGKWLLDSKSEQPAPSAADVYKKAAEMGIEKKHKTVQVLIQALIDGEGWAESLKRYGAVVAKMASASEKHQKALLGGLERAVGVHHPELVSATPKVLMALYQADAFSDEAALHEWGSHVSKKYTGDKEVSKKVRKSAAPFLTWLKEAESDDEDDEEEDDDAKKPAASAGKTNGKPATAASTPKKKESDDGEDSDLDNL